MIVLFVHGLGGKALDTWGMFRRCMDDDAKMAGTRVGYFEYPSQIFSFPFISKRNSSIDRLADGLKTFIDTTFPGNEPIVLVCHSLGGLIARQYLVDQAMIGEAQRVSKIMLYAVPNTGASLAKVAKYVSWRNPQLKQLGKGSDFLFALNRSWARFGMTERIKTKYVVGGADEVVREDSAESFPGNPSTATLPGRGHRDCIRPTSTSDIAYQIFQQFITEKDSPSHPSRGTSKGYKVVAFDLDGTILRGIQFSWTLIWDAFGFDPAIQKLGMRRYTRRETTNAEWAAWCVENFRKKGVTRTSLEDMADDHILLTKYFAEGIDMIRQAGLKTAIISGGIDTFLYRKIPNADQLFDYVFINRMKFSPNGDLSGIEATEYDFEGKALALEKICDELGCGTGQAVFVGEGFNDTEITKTAGLSIAYPPKEAGNAAACHISIEDDDLRLVAHEILNS